MSATGETNRRPNAPAEIKPIPTNPEDLRVFLNEGGIYELAKPLEYLLEASGEPLENSKIIITEPGEDDSREFQAYWQPGLDRNKYRVLVVHSNLLSIAGLFLTVPVELDDYIVSPHGSISASCIPKIEAGRSKVEHYLNKEAGYMKKGAGLEVGKPDIVVRVHRKASDLLLRACGVEKIEELDAISATELSAA